MGWLHVAGGLGLFLLGMVIMTEGLRGIAGDALQRVLRRMTRSPSSGAGAGALVTAVVQSSSATTVTAVGFAGAGLLTFPEALGIVFGANLGTTLTGWMVALLGFKIGLGEVMPPVILVGVLLRLFASGRLAATGYALAGFGLIFVGIDGLRAGMLGLEDQITPDTFPADTVGGRLRLVGIGVALTLVTQSSSAGVAAALAAVSVGAIGFPQAASLVIGMDVGTSVTAALATLGASLPARRTGWAHVIYNLLTGLAAFGILPLFVIALEAASTGITATQPELCLVGFHTFFNLMGVVAVLPVARPFARLVERLVPERPAPFTARLDRSLLHEPEVAMRAVTPTLEELAEQVFAILGEQLGERAPPDRSERRALLELAFEEVRLWLGQIDSPRLGSDAEAREVAALHVIDQLGRLLDREAQTDRARTASMTPELQAIGHEIAAALDVRDASRLDALTTRLAEGRSAYRADVLGRAGRDEIDSTDAMAQADAHRWLERVAHHAWRASHHLDRLRGEAPTPTEVEPPEPD